MTDQTGDRAQGRTVRVIERSEVGKWPSIDLAPDEEVLLTETQTVLYSSYDRTFKHILRLVVAVPDGGQSGRTGQ